MLRALKHLFIVTLILPLTACLSVELDLEFHDDEQVTMTTFMSFSKEIFEQIGATAEGGVCEGAETIVSDTEISCVTSEVIPLETALAKGLSTGNEESGQSLKASIRRINDNVLALSVPIETSSEQSGGDNENDEMQAAILTSFEGQDFRIWVTGAKILASNGIISEDQRSSLMSIPMTDLIGNSETVPKSFEVVFSYR